MSHERGVGAAAHTYDPAALIQCLLMKAKMTPGVSLQEGLATAAPLFFGHLSAGGLVGELRDGSIQLPQDSVRQDAQIRLDILDPAWQRSRCSKFECWRYGAIDASSAFGNSWFLAREDIFEFSLDAFAPCRGDVPLPSDLNASLKNRTLPMSTLGRGRANLIKKSFSYLNILRMESPSEDAFKGGGVRRFTASWQTRGQKRASQTSARCGILRNSTPLTSRRLSALSLMRCG